jgi:UMF1 family MFS transporter
VNYQTGVVRSDEATDPPNSDQKATTFQLISWAFFDWANSAFATVVQTFIFAAYFTNRVAASETSGTTQWGNTLSIAGIIVALIGPVLGALADQGGRRKPWIAVFTVLCVISMASLWFVKPSSSYLRLALILVALGTVTSECAMIFYNSMLPAMVKPDNMGRWSGWGWSLGYAGGLMCLVFCLFAFVKTENPWFFLDNDSAQNVRAAFVFAAAWHMLFVLPLLLFTPDTRSTGKSLFRALRDGLQQLRDSIRRIRRYSNIVRFLIARMIYIDGLATVFAFGGVYAAGTFDMNAQQVLIFGIALNVTAGLGAAGFGWIDDRIGPKRTILISLAGLIISGTAILLVHSTALFWTFGLILGVFVGPVQASSRSFLGRIAPEHLRSQMFGLYALSGKATSFIGPLMVGWITAWTCSQRIGMSATIVLFFIGAILMLAVSTSREKVSG